MSSSVQALMGLTSAADLAQHAQLGAGHGELAFQLAEFGQQVLAEPAEVWGVQIQSRPRSRELRNRESVMPGLYPGILGGMRRTQEMDGSSPVMTRRQDITPPRLPCGGPSAPLPRSCRPYRTR